MLDRGRIPIIKAEARVFLKRQQRRKQQKEQGIETIPWEAKQAVFDTFGSYSVENGEQYADEITKDDDDDEEEEEEEEEEVVVQLDISMQSSSHTGLASTAFVQELVETLPMLRPLALVVKQVSLREVRSCSCFNYT